MNNTRVSRPTMHYITPIYSWRPQRFLFFIPTIPPTILQLPSDYPTPSSSSYSFSPVPSTSVGALSHLGMKLAKKLLASRVNSVRPYKSRSKRPCDFCRRRKTCCIIENLIPCMACAQFNKGVCTFLEGPLKRRNRKNGESRSKRGRKLSNEADLPSGLDSGDTYVLLMSLTTAHDNSVTPSGLLDTFLPLSGQVLYNEISRGWQNSDASPLAGTGFAVSSSVGAGAGASSSPMLGGGNWYGPMALAPTVLQGSSGLQALGLLGLLGLGSVSQGNLGHTDSGSYMRDARYPEMTLGAWHNTHGRASAPDIYLRQLTLSSMSTMSTTSFWLDILPGYETLLSMLNDVDDGKRYSSNVYPPAQSYFQPQHLHHAPQVQIQTQAHLLDSSTTVPTGWSYSDYVGGLTTTNSDALTLQGTLGSAGYSQSTHTFASGPNEAIGELLA